MNSRNSLERAEWSILQAHSYIMLVWGACWLKPWHWLSLKNWRNVAIYVGHLVYSISWQSLKPAHSISTSSSGKRPKWQITWFKISSPMGLKLADEYIKSLQFAKILKKSTRGSGDSCFCLKLASKSDCFFKNPSFSFLSRAAWVEKLEIVLQWSLKCQKVLIVHPSLFTGIISVPGCLFWGEASKDWQGLGIVTWH